MSELILSEFSQKGEEIYQQKISPQLPIDDLKGKIVAIEVDSGEYFIEKTVLKAITLAQKKYPNKKFYLKRIGYEAVHSHKGKRETKNPIINLYSSHICRLTSHVFN